MEALLVNWDDPELEEVIEQSSDNTVYWFPQTELLCTYKTKSNFFYVLNGCWEFQIKSRRIIADVPHMSYTNGRDQDLGYIEKPYMMTRARFDQLHPDFGY